MSKIGIYAGTFDPVHNGHVAFARSALATCGLDEVVFFPDRDPWRKTNVTDIAHRQALLEQAVRDEQGMRVTLLDVGRFTPRVVVPELKRLFADDELVLLMGSDLARTLQHSWPSVDVLLAAMSLAIGLRGNDEATDIEAVLQQLVRAHGPVAYQIFSAPLPGAASTLVRGGDHSTLHPEVSEYIKRHGLYDIAVR